jgi:hypothetical protein
VLSDPQIKPTDQRSAHIRAVSAGLAGNPGGPVKPRAIYRDPQDVKTILQLARCGLVLALPLTVSVAGNFY